MIRAFARLTDRLIPESLIALVTRLGVAAIFFQSGRTKVDGLLHITDGTYSLFREEYRLPLIPSDIAAHLATYSEHLFAILLALGLFTRFSALAFLGMTVVMTALFYGWGLNLLGTVPTRWQWLFVLGGWDLMLGWSAPWLLRFRQGPLEWAWRSLTYAQVMPWRRTP